MGTAPMVVVTAVSSIGLCFIHAFERLIQSELRVSFIETLCN